MLDYRGEQIQVIEVRHGLWSGSHGVLRCERCVLAAPSYRNAGVFLSLSAADQGLLQGTAMNLLHIDSSVLGENSASRALSAAIVARLRAEHPGLHTSYRDLAAQSLPHFTPT